MDEPALHDPATYRRGFPYEVFRRLRDEEPVSHHEHPGWDRGYWAVTRHDDVRRVSRDTETFRNAPHPFFDAAADAESTMAADRLICLDGRDHTRMRRLISAAFTPKRVTALTERVHARVDEILAALDGRRSCDLVDDIAMWLPLHVIADLVGVPEEDRRQVFAWTETTFGFDAATTVDDRRRAAMEMYGYADRLCEERRRRPRDDLMSALLAAELDGDRLTALQIGLFFLLLQNAGTETTRNLISSGVVALLAHPEQVEALRQGPSLWPIAVEELLRYVCPVMNFARTATVDAEVGGRRIPAGDHVVLFYTSANRDERSFRDPDALDVSRTPNDHVSFGGGGPHHCLGANLARLEARIMLEGLFTRFEGLRLVDDPDALPRLHSSFIDGFAHVPVAWDTLLPEAP